MPDKKPCELLTWSEFDRLSRKLASLVRDSDFDPDIIVAVGRGGYMPARMLADCLGLMDLVSFRIVHYRGSRKEKVARVQFPLSADLTGRKVLLVDDVSDSGDTFVVAMNHLAERGNFIAIRTAALHHKVTARFEPDFYARKMTHWRWIVYPWAMTEDIGAFIQAMQPAPQSAEETAARLKQDHGLELNPDKLAEILAFVAHPSRGSQV